VFAAAGRSPGAGNRQGVAGVCVLPVPEGPEIRLAADRIAKVLVGEVVVDAQLRLPDLKRFERRLGGATVTAVDTRGKAMLTRFDNGLTLYSHNQLYGRWYTSRRPKMPETNRSLRVALHTSSHSALLYSASDIEVLTASELAEHPFLQRAGPDILDPSLTAKDVAMRLSSTRFCRRSLGALYLDQAFLAGIGNYLRSEILFTAGQHPGLRPNDLDAKSLNRLGRETLKISRRSYATRGVTVTPALAAKLKARSLAYGQYRFWVFGRDGLSCHTCGTTIERMAVNGRWLFYCPVCQPLV